MKTLFLTALILPVFVFSQNQTEKPTEEPQSKKEVKDSLKAKEEENNVEWERPFNFFAAAGASAMIGNHYNVTISPIDRTVQFEKTFPILTRFSLGLVWNPFPERKGDYIERFTFNKLSDDEYRLARDHAAVALLINVFQLSYASDFNYSAPIDVGFGAGYRNSNFLLLFTFELTPFRSPRKYFTDQYKDKNLPLILAGNTEPLQTISTDDNSLFVNRIYPSFGVKIAYSFTKQKSK